MSDFTDDEDYQIVQIARMLLMRPGNHQVNWSELARLVIGSKKSKGELRQRLKTLKRKYGNDVNAFPKRFFKKCPILWIFLKALLLVLALPCAAVVMEIPSPRSSRHGVGHPSISRLESTPGGNDDETLDRTPWPINRLSYQDLKVAELDAIDKLFAPRDDSPLLMKWVMQCTRGVVFRKRLLVVSALRVWLLRRKKSLRTTIECVEVYQLIHVSRIVVMRGCDIESVATPDPALATSTCATTPVKIYFASSTASSTDSEDTIELSTLHMDPGTHSESIVRLLQRQLHALRFAFPSGSPPPVRFHPRCNWQEFFSLDDTPRRSDSSQTVNGSFSMEEERQLSAQFTAISAAYRAFCDDLHAPYRESVMTRLQECARSFSCIDFQYCLAIPTGDESNQHHSSQGVDTRHADSRNHHDSGALDRAAKTMLRCFGFGPPSRATLLLRETQALAFALHHADFVDNIVVRQLQLKDDGVAALFQSLVSATSTVQGLALHDVRLSTSGLRLLQNIVLQSTIQHERVPEMASARENKLGMRRLDLSFNRFSQKMAGELAVTLELLPHGLELFYLERCALSEAASCLLLSSIGGNAAFAGSLRELNLSGNHLGREGTKILASWLTGAFTLRQLDVSRTALDLNCFCIALQQNSILSESALAYLDISYNRMRSHASQALGLVLGKTRSLATLVLRGMMRFHIARITVGRRHSSFGISLTSKLRSRQVKRGLTISTSGRGGAKHTRGLKCEHLRNILSPMFANAGRVAPAMVDLSENDLRGKKAELLAQLLDASPTIPRQSLRLDHTRLHDRSSLLLLHSIRGCATLNSLSLEGNGIVKRSTQRKRVLLDAQRTSCQVQGDATRADNLAPGNSLEQAAARVFSLLVGGSRAKADASEAGVVDSDGQSRSHPRVQLPVPLLQELCLKSYSSFVFGSITIAAVVDALAFTSSLRVLDVAGNECGDALAYALGRVLPCNSSLQTLFWDDNFTSVDGFFAFYAGLVPNHSLTMVQMPIQDTRRILERQKDPPREKLFSVLGKIFKATERNQENWLMARQRANERYSDDNAEGIRDAHLAHSANNQVEHGDPAGPSRLMMQHPHNQANEKWSQDDQCSLTLLSSPCAEIELQVHAEQRQMKHERKAHGAIDKPKDSAMSQTPTMPRCPSPNFTSRAKSGKRRRAGDELIASSSIIYQSRYPSTMHSWDLGAARSCLGVTGSVCDSIDFTAQWNELNALSTSFSTT